MGMVCPTMSSCSSSLVHGVELSLILLSRKLHDNRAFQTFGGFTSGIGVHYSPSAIVDIKHQQCAESLVIGQRMIPQVFVRAADTRPVEIQDLLPSNARFKILFFVGDLSGTKITELSLLAEELGKPSSVLLKYSAGGKISTVFDVITIATGKKDDINFLLVPAFFRPHWTKYVLFSLNIVVG